MTRGRPKKSLSDSDWEKVELYLKSGATQKKIAAAFCMSTVTFRIHCEERYGEKYHDTCESFTQTGEILIEAMQFQKALQGNVQLLIWLGKVRCGQRDVDAVNNLAPYQAALDKDHEIMMLKNELNEIKMEIEYRNGNKLKTG